MLEVDDLSDRVAPNRERGYRATPVAAEIPAPAQLVQDNRSRTPSRTACATASQGQFSAAVLAKVAADAGLLRYGYFLAEPG